MIHIGIYHAKSKTIRAIDIPQKYFADFLRGRFDGDGTFYVYWDKRWPNSFGFKTAFASAIPPFVLWLKGRLAKLYKVKGYLHQGPGVLNLEYTKGDSKKIFHAMHYDTNNLCFSKKYLKMKSAFMMDEKVGLSFLQKQRMPR